MVPLDELRCVVTLWGCRYRLLMSMKGLLLCDVALSEKATAKMSKVDVVAVVMGIGDPMGANNQTLEVVGLVERPEATRMGVGDRCRVLLLRFAFEESKGDFQSEKSLQLP